MNRRSDYATDYATDRARARAFPASLFRWRRERNRSFATPSAEAIARKPDFLREVHVFASLSAGELRWLKTSTAMVVYQRGSLFYRPGDRGEVLFILKEGRANFFRVSGDGRRLNVETLRAGTVFGEMALVGQAMYGCYAEAAEDSLLCVLSRTDMQTILRRNPDVAIRMMDDLGQRLRNREAALESMAFHSVSSRLAALLLLEADSTGQIVGQTHQDLANSLGTYRETVSDILGKFRTRNFVETDHRRIRLIDPEGLREVIAS